MKRLLFLFLFGFVFSLFGADDSTQERQMNELLSLISTTQHMREETGRNERIEEGIGRDSELAREFRKQQRLLRHLERVAPLHDDVVKLQRYTRAFYDNLGDIDPYTAFNAYGVLIEKMIDMHAEYAGALGKNAQAEKQILLMREHLARLGVLTDQLTLYAFDQATYDTLIKFSSEAVSDIMIANMKITPKEHTALSMYNGQ